MLTGVIPFHGKNVQETLSNNKKGIIDYTESCWESVSSEAKDLVVKMVAIDPNERCTATEALSHKWFSLDHTNSALLSNAQINMKKYNKDCENRFNVSRIKPEFSMITCTPLLNSRFSGKDSPLIIPKIDGITKRMNILINGNKEEKKKRNCF